MLSLLLMLAQQQAAAAAATVDAAVVEDEFEVAETGGWPSSRASHCCEDRTVD